MRAISRFSLERHGGPYESWPLTSRLPRDGVVTDARVAGYALLHQFELAEGYLFLSDYECPYEERTVFTLLDPRLRVLASRGVGGMYDSYLLTRAEPSGASALVAAFTNGFELRVTVRPWGIPFLSAASGHPPGADSLSLPASGPAGVKPFTLAVTRQRGHTHDVLRRESLTMSYEVEFTSELFTIEGKGGWTFAPVPEQCAPSRTEAWGRAPVVATVDGRTWKTSVWRERTGRTLLPVPKAVRGPLRHGDTVQVRLVYGAL